MRLLKTVLLSTTLLMGVVSAADLSGGAAQEASEGSAVEDYIAIVKSSEDFKRKVVGGLLRTITKFTGESAESLAKKGLTPGSEVAPALKALLSMLSAITGEKTDIASQLATATAANEKLTAEKAAAEAALVTATEQLAAVITAKDAVDEKLAAAGLKVAALTEELNTVKTAKEEAGRDATGVIERLTGELAAAKDNVVKLTTQVAELDDLKVEAEKAKQVKAAGLRALMAHVGGPKEALRAGQSAVTNSDFDPFDNFDTLPTGAEDDGNASPQSLLGDDDDLDGASPLQRFSAEGSPTRRSLETTLEAATTIKPETAAQIAKLQTELATAQAKTAASPFTGRNSKKKNEDAQAAAQADVTRLTAALKELGVDVTAAAASK